MKALLPRLLILALGVLALAGCLGGPDINSINIGITEIKPGSRPDELRVTLFYANENVIPIAIERTTHSIYLNGKLLGKCNSLDPVGLPPAKVTNATIILVVQDKALLDSLIASSASQTANYKIESKIFILSGEEKLSAKFSGSGAVDLRGLTAK